MAIPCPYCRSKNVRILSSRDSIVNKQHTLRRRKKCLECKERYTTRELLDAEWEALGYLKNMKPTEISNVLALIKKAQSLLSKHDS